MDGARRCVRIARCTNTPNGGWLLGVRLGPGGLIGTWRRIACPYTRPWNVAKDCLSLYAPLLSSAARLGAVVPLCALQMQGLTPRHHGSKVGKRGMTVSGRRAAVIHRVCEQGRSELHGQMKLGFEFFG